MKRKQMERLFGVTIYQTNKGYVIEIPNEESRVFPYMSDIEWFLSHKYRQIWLDNQPKK